MWLEGKPGKGKAWQKKRYGIGRQREKKEHPPPPTINLEIAQTMAPVMCPHSLSLKITDA